MSLNRKRRASNGLEEVAPKRLAESEPASFKTDDKYSVQNYIRMSKEDAIAGNVVLNCILDKNRKLGIKKNLIFQPIYSMYFFTCEVKIVLEVITADKK